MIGDLSLTPFERCMLFDARPSYPGSCFTRCQFTGKLDRNLFLKSLEVTLVGHPFLRAKLKSGRKLKWTFPETTPLQVSWAYGSTGGCFPTASPFNLLTETGLKVFIVQDHSTVDMTVQFHHACCDGAGIDRFLCDLFVNYDREYKAATGSQNQTTVEPNVLRRRGKYGLTIWKALKLFPGQMVGLLGVAQFLGRKPQPLIPYLSSDVPDETCDKHTETSAFPASVGTVIDAALTRALRIEASRRGVTLNELLIRDFFLTLWEWQEKHGYRDSRHWMRLMIPFNVRYNSHRRLPAMNFVSSVFLDRRPPDGHDSVRLLHSIRHEMDVIKRFRLQFTSLFSLQLFNLIPGALKNSVRKDQCKTTAIFSNTGKALRHCRLPRTDGCLHVGDLLLVGIDGLAPVRPYNCVTILALEYAGRLRVNLHYDAKRLSEPRAKQLLQLFTDRLAANCS